MMTGVMMTDGARNKYMIIELKLERHLLVLGVVYTNRTIIPLKFRTVLNKYDALVIQKSRYCISLYHNAGATNESQSAMETVQRFDNDLDLYSRRQ